MGDQYLVYSPVICGFYCHFQIFIGDFFTRLRDFTQDVYDKPSYRLKFTLWKLDVKILFQLLKS